MIADLPLVVGFILLIIFGLALGYMMIQRKKRHRPEEVKESGSPHNQDLNDGFQGPGTGYSEYGPVAGPPWTGDQADVEGNSGSSGQIDPDAANQNGSAVPSLSELQPSVAEMLEPSTSTVSSPDPDDQNGSDPYSPGGFVNQPFLPEQPGGGGAPAGGNGSQSSDTNGMQNGGSGSGDPGTEPVSGSETTQDGSTSFSGSAGSSGGPNTDGGPSGPDEQFGIDPSTLDPVLHAQHYTGVLTKPPELFHPDLPDPEELFRAPLSTNAPGDPAQFVPDMSPTTFAPSTIPIPDPVVTRSSPISPDGITDPESGVSQLLPQTPIAPVEPDPAHDGKWTCPDCGSEPGIQFMFCTECGHKRHV